MDIKEFAKLINREELRYPLFTEEEVKIAKENGFVIVFGWSDDLMEFEGAICDEADCFEGGKVYVCETGVVGYGTPKTKFIEALSCDKEALDENGNVITWTYKTDIPHETFTIYEGGKLYCRGIVFSVDSLK